MTGRAKARRRQVMSEGRLSWRPLLIATAPGPPSVSPLDDLATFGSTATMVPGDHYGVDGAEMELFRAEKFGDLESSDDSLRECRSCDNKLRLVRAVYYPETEETIRVFECDCGERIWDE